MTITSKGNSLVLSEKREQGSAGLDGLICMTSARSALICFYIHNRTAIVLQQLTRAIVSDVLKSHKHIFFFFFWWISAPVNDKRLLIKGLVPGEMYPSSRLLRGRRNSKRMQRLMS